jgi:phosphodiesterase/alkaline phosphatase D-like protein
MPTINGCAFLEMAAAMGVTAACTNPLASASPIPWQEGRDLFPEGVASGDPDSHSVLPWRRCPQARQDSTLRPTVEVSEDKTSSQQRSPSQLRHSQQIGVASQPAHHHAHLFRDQRLRSFRHALLQRIQK